MHAPTGISTRIRHAIMAALCVAGSALVAGEARADAKLVPATVCQPLVEPQPFIATSEIDEDEDKALETLLNIRYDRNGRVLNQSLTKRLGVVCPITRDNTQRALEWIRVIYVDQHPDPVMPSADKHEVLECEVRAAAGVSETPSDKEKIDTLGGGFDVPGPLPGTGSGVWWFHGLDKVKSGDATKDSPYAISHYTLTCLIPPRFGTQLSWIAGIMIDEP